MNVFEFALVVIVVVGGGGFIFAVATARYNDRLERERGE